MFFDTLASRSRENPPSRFITQRRQMLPIPIAKISLVAFLTLDPCDRVRHVTRTTTNSFPKKDIMLGYVKKKMMLKSSSAEMA